jgi:hypothetical protein
MVNRASIRAIKKRKGKMKIKDEHYEIIRHGMLRHRDEFERHLEDAKLNKRCRNKERCAMWGLYYSVPDLHDYVIKNVYIYADDSHLEAALKKITRELKGMTI